MRIRSTLMLALPLLALAAPAGANQRPPEQRDQTVALRATARWIATYPAGLWIGVELPQPCRALPSGRRTCAIAIRLLAWTDGALAPWRCTAHAVLPAPRERAAARVRRTSADCAPLDATGRKSTDPPVG